MVDVIETGDVACRRRHNCQRFLLCDVREGKTVDEAVAGIVGLHKTKPAQYVALTLTPQLLAPRTFRGYWAELPPSQRLNARRTGGARRSARARAQQSVRGRNTQQASH
jgi:hypothetical protein